MKSKLVRLVIASIVLGLILSWGYGSSADVAQSAAGSASNFTFGQLDWYDEDDLLQIDDSSWGYLEVDVVGDPTHIEYLNVTADAGNGEAWIVQNLPIFPDTIGNASPRQGVDFDITLLGLSSGTDLASLDFVFAVDAAIQTAPPAGPMSTEPVADVEWRSIDSKLVVGAPGPMDVGAPQGIQIQDAVKNMIQHKDVPGVQEEYATCLAGAFARSIAWLLGKKTDADAQKIYDDLRALKVGSSGPNATTYEEDIKAKADYLKGKIPGARTKINDLQNAIGPVAGVTEEKKDLVGWLKKELPTEDVELHRQGHIVTVTGMYESGGKTFIKFRDDETQGNKDGTQENKDKGDKAEKTGELRKVGDDYQFREKGTKKWFTVQAAISESPPSVGGIVEVLADASDSSASSAGGSGSSSPPYALIAGIAAAAALAIAGGAWYARRRWLG